MTATVADAPERSRFEISVDGALAGFAVYRLAPGRITFVHTEIDDAYAGQGLGGQLARAALDDVRGRGLAVRPVIARTFPLEQAANAQEELARREHVGKIVLRP